LQLRTLGWIEDRAVAAHGGAGRQASLIDMRRPKDVHHTLTGGEEIVGDDTPVAAPPDGLGAHDCAPVLAAQLMQPRKACGEKREPANRRSATVPRSSPSPEDRQAREYVHSRSATGPAFWEGFHR